jgi:hypothetical protein
MKWTLLRGLFLLGSLGVGLAICHAAADPSISSWDKNLLSMELGSVDVSARSLGDAWEDITSRYLVHANICMDGLPDSAPEPFEFHKERVTVRELLGALATTYPEFTYTQNPRTGIMWAHSRRVGYDDILKQKVNILRDSEYLPMYSGILEPLCKLLAPGLQQPFQAGLYFGMVDPGTGRPPTPVFWLYDVNVAKGVLSVREILDLCCAADPTKAFIIRPNRGQTQWHIVYLNDLMLQSPLAPPRPPILKFWELEVGKPAGRIPSYDEVVDAMSSSDPSKRRAACLYIRGALQNYSYPRFMQSAADSEKEVWTALGLQYATGRFADTNYFRAAQLTFPRLQGDLRGIRSPGLALLASLRLRSEGQDSSYLDGVCAEHKFTETETADILPELIRLARHSSAVRERLRGMSLSHAALSGTALAELGNENFASLYALESK